jgi:hypothetical protein
MLPCSSVSRPQEGPHPFHASQIQAISDCHNLALWAAIVVGFFSFLWASNLVPKGAQDFEGVLFLQSSNIQFTDKGAVFKVRRSKTNQF